MINTYVCMGPIADKPSTSDGGEHVALLHTIRWISHGLTARTIMRDGVLWKQFCKVAQGHVSPILWNRSQFLNTACSTKVVQSNPETAFTVHSRKVPPSRFRSSPLRSGSAFKVMLSFRFRNSRIHRTTVTLSSM